MLNYIYSMDSRIKFVMDTIGDEYLFGGAGKPWVIGFSGGKDSTCMLQLVWLVMRDIRASGKPLDRRIIISSNDTLVENPVIADMLHRVIVDISAAARAEKMPIESHITRPKVAERFWVKVIGSGYPLPNTLFRWCTERLKIQPTSALIEKLIGEYGEAVLLIGTRLSESRTREESMKKHNRRNKRLSNHPTHTGLRVFAPIDVLDIEHVWGIIRGFECPWGSNDELFSIYMDANSDDYECPTVVTSKNHKSCGQSRFGCWVCPVVTKDKSMTALVNSGREELRPLLDFRNAIVAERSDVTFRMPQRRNGQDAVNGMGPYTIAYRASLLQRLLLIQKQTGLKLIDTAELMVIGDIWRRDWFEFKTTVRGIMGAIA